MFLGHVSKYKIIQFMRKCMKMESNIIDTVFISRSLVYNYVQDNIGLFLRVKYMFDYFYIYILISPKHAFSQ